jgi:antitoxin PrlF
MGMPVTVKGQVTIPKPMRDRLGLKPGSRVEFEALPDGRVAMRKAPSPDSDYAERLRKARGTATELAGMSTDEIMQLLRGDDEA